jgi:hypothetical protein
MTLSDFSLAFGFGVVGSIHCVQMCGPIVLTYSLQSSPGARGAMASHIFYNLGRLVTYSALGAFAGVAGGAMGVFGRLAGIEKAAMVVAGALMIAAGILMAGYMPKGGLVQVSGKGVSSLFSRTVGKLLVSPAPAGRFLLGLILGLLPCGLLYAALLKAMSSGTAVSGAFTMLAFGLGTSAALLAIGAFSSVVSARLGRWANVLASVSVILVGAWLVWKGYMAQPHQMMGHHHGHS